MRAVLPPAWSFAIQGANLSLRGPCSLGGNVVGLEAAKLAMDGDVHLKHFHGQRLRCWLSCPTTLDYFIWPVTGPAYRKTKCAVEKLFEDGRFDAMSYQLALAEPIPDKPLPLPRIARHLLDRVIAGEKRVSEVQSSIDRELQLQVEAVVDERVEQTQCHPRI